MKYSAQIAQAYAQNRQIHPHVLRQLILTGNLTTNSRVLEVGCGTGNYITAVQEATQCWCVGLDASVGMLAQAATRPVPAKFLAASAESPGLKNEWFDLLFSVDVIHHVRGPAKYFEQAFRLIKSGGLLCTITDSEWIIRHRQPLATYWPETIEPELRRYPRIPHLKALMRQVGFVRITTHMVEFNYSLPGLKPFEEKAFSALHIIKDDAFQRGLKRMRADLQAGPISCVSRYVMLWGTKYGD